MSTEHLGNEEGCRNNDDNNLSFADTWYEQGKKKSPHVFVLQRLLWLGAIILQP